MSVYDWEDVGGDIADYEAMLEEASEICEERGGGLLWVSNRKGMSVLDTKGARNDI